MSEVVMESLGTESEQLVENLRAVRERVQAACERAGRPVSDVTLIAVSKTHSVSAIRALYAAGQRHFGESYVQEWQQKAQEFAGVGSAVESDDDGLVWHFIGHLQSNKARFVADEVGLIHSVDRPSVMRVLQQRASHRVNVLLQVNIAHQASKEGVSPEGLLELLAAARSYDRLRVCGLMCIPPYVDDAEDNRVHFREMRALFGQARAWLGEHVVGEERDRALADFRQLSMGMSGDFEVAIEEGATLVRVGSAIFGARDYSK